MIIRNRWRMAAAQFALWLVAAAAVTYFGQQAYVGDHGLVASRSKEAEVAWLSQRLDTLKAERSAIEHRIDLLSTERLDPDLLDEQARDDLGWLSPSDRVIKTQ